MPSTPSHPAGCYYVNRVSGTIQRQCNPVAAMALGTLGFIGCDQLPAAGFNACPTFAAAQALAGSSTGSGLVNSTVGFLEAPFNAIGNFFSFLTDRGTWIRIGEGVLGLLLLVIGARVLIENEILNSKELDKILGVAKVAAK